MLKVHKTDINIIIKIMHAQRARASARALETESEKASERKAGCRRLYNTRERAICAGNKGAQL